MMWFFIVSDALTFSGFIVSYGFARFKYANSWPIADEVFTHVPFMHGQELPMIYVAFMTFVLIMSSVTMVLAVDAGHKMNKAKVTFYMFLTIIGGIIFVGSQAWEKYFMDSLNMAMGQIDWGMKWIPQLTREMSTEWYGKVRNLIF